MRRSPTLPTGWHRWLVLFAIAAAWLGASSVAVAGIGAAQVSTAGTVGDPPNEVRGSATWGTPPDIVIDNGASSISLLVDRLGLCEVEAAGMLELLEALKIVGPNGGGKARSVLVEHDEADRLIDDLTGSR